MSRLSYKQMTEKTLETAKRLGIEGFLHLNASYGYYQLHMYQLDGAGKKSTAILQLMSGTLAEVNAYLDGSSGLKYQVEKLKSKMSFPSIRSIATGSMNDALGDKWKTLTGEQVRRLENFLASEIHNALNYGEEIITKDDYLNLIRDSYAYAIKTAVNIGE